MIKGENGFELELELHRLRLMTWRYDYDRHDLPEESLDLGSFIGFAS